MSLSACRPYCNSFRRSYWIIFWRKTKCSKVNKGRPASVEEGQVDKELSSWIRVRVCQAQYSSPAGRRRRCSIAAWLCIKRSFLKHIIAPFSRWQLDTLWPSCGLTVVFNVLWQTFCSLWVHLISFRTHLSFATSCSNGAYNLINRNNVFLFIYSRPAIF